jgi:hypothetical protein
MLAANDSFINARANDTAQTKSVPNERATGIRFQCKAKVKGTLTLDPKKRQ